MKRRVTTELIDYSLLPPPFHRLTIENYRGGVGSPLYHAHADFQIMVVHTGCMELLTEQTERRLRPGDAILIPAECRHTWRTPEPTETLQILMGREVPRTYGLLAQLVEDCVGEPLTIRIPPEELREAMVEFRLLQKRRERGDELLVQGRLLRLAGLLVKAAVLLPRASCHQGVRAVILAVLDHPEAAWTLAEMSRRAALGQSRFSELFRKQTGLSPMKFVIARRVEYAQQLLRRVDWGMEEIVSSLRMRSVSYFIRCFKARYGVTPAAYRRRA